MTPRDCSTPVHYCPFPAHYYLLEACSNSCPFTWWCHQSSHPLLPCLQSPAFSSCLQSFPASGSFPMSWLFASGGQSIGASASGSVLTVNIQGWFPLGLTSLISLLSKGLKSLLQHHNSNNSSVLSLIYGPTLTIHTWLLEKPQLSYPFVCWYDAFKQWCWRRLLSPLDSKEMKPVDPKGNQSWIFFERTDDETEAPILWPPAAKKLTH